MHFQISVMIMTLATFTPSLAKPLHTRNKDSYWAGFKKTKYLFVFGDSYTTTQFNRSGVQPSSGNPLGNPSYPGLTSCNGPNWVDYLTTTNNASELLTYNIASGGATIDSNLVKPYKDTVLSFEQQIQEFIQYYPANPSTASWTPVNSLFAIWFGLNDVGISYSKSNYTTVEPQIIEAYTATINQLYSAGARNFLLLTVPPMDQSPATTKYGAKASANEKAAIEVFNSDIANMLLELENDHSDVTSFLYDANSLMTEILQDPTRYNQTKGYTVLHSYCEYYADYDDLASPSSSSAPSLSMTESIPQAKSTLASTVSFSPSLPNSSPIPSTSQDLSISSIETNYSSTNSTRVSLSNNTWSISNATILPDVRANNCGVPLSQYFWFNDLHPTYPVHQVLAQEIASTLK